MKSDKNIYRTLARKITINLAQQQENRRKCAALSMENAQLEENIRQLLAELKTLTQENQDLKDLVISLNQELEKVTAQGQ